MPDDRARVIIADDEPLARRRVHTLLSTHNDFEIVAECADGLETMQSLATLQPDVLLLDIEMPGVNGLRLIEQETSRPVVVFITAYESYAVEAFAVHALDYLLKPFDEERFTLTLNRIRDELARERTSEAHHKLLSAARELGVPDPTRLVADRLTLGDIEVDVRARRVWRDRRQVVLRRKEFDVLVRLLRSAGEVVTRQELLNDVWGYKNDVVSRTIDTHVFELRRKLQHTAGDAGYIETVARIGYRILATAERVGDQLSP